jgi:hypothetical protein
VKTSFALAVALLPAVLTLAACGGNTDPNPLADRYTLAAVQGHPTPRFMGATEACDVYVNGGTLSFGQANSFDLRVDVMSDCSRSGVPDPTVVTYGYAGTVQLHGETGVEFISADAGGDVSFDGTIDSDRRITLELPTVFAFVSHVTLQFEPS